MADLWYPLAKKHVLDSDHYRVSTIKDKNGIVLHITEGTTASGAITGWENRHGRDAVSAHFVIERDGLVTQCVSIADIAWHARQANAHSIGIEHVALSKDGAFKYNTKYAEQIKAGTQRPFFYMPATELQYTASAKLIVWATQQLGISIDRNHIRTHNEASPIDHHFECCTGALDPDRLVTLAIASPQTVSV